jgi:hypothetical protein
MDRMPHARLRVVIAAVLALAPAMAGCSSDDGDEAPAACLTDSGGYLAALEAAPGEVLLEGETPISDCLTPGQEGGELAQVGKELIDAATVLNAEARRDPSGPAAVRLGYLVGAVEKGAEGIHADLVRRTQSAANFSPDGQLPPAFEAGFAEGYAAGRDDAPSG